MNLHSLDLNEIRGYGRKKPIITAAFAFGTLGIGGVPLFNGYISKTLLHESIVEYIEELRHVGEAAGIYKAVEWAFLFAGGITVAYMTKLFVAIFIEKPARQFSGVLPIYNIDSLVSKKEVFWGFFGKYF